MKTLEDDENTLILIWWHSGNCSNCVAMLRLIWGHRVLARSSSSSDLRNSSISPHRKLNHLDTIVDPVTPHRITCPFRQRHTATFSTPHKECHFPGDRGDDDWKHIGEIHTLTIFAAARARFSPLFSFRSQIAKRWKDEREKRRSSGYKSLGFQDEPIGYLQHRQ